MQNKTIQQYQEIPFVGKFREIRVKISQNGRQYKQVYFCVIWDGHIYVFLNVPVQNSITKKKKTRKPGR